MIQSITGCRVSAISGVAPSTSSTLASALESPSSRADSSSAWAVVPQRRMGTRCAETALPAAQSQDRRSSGAHRSRTDRRGRSWSGRLRQQRLDACQRRPTLLGVELIEFSGTEFVDQDVLQLIATATLE
ncbi:MAG: hypothetical protein MZV64_10190 [Ignavibacteriales bacterium]|nr:hypothetical protein [Ignavibacteriales bacterium]